MMDVFEVEVDVVLPHIILRVFHNGLMVRIEGHSDAQVEAPAFTVWE